MNFRVDTTAISCRSRTQVALQRAYTLHAYSFSLIVKRRPFLRKDRSIGKDRSALMGSVERLENVIGS